MIFLYRDWEKLCRKLAERGIYSIPAREVFSLQQREKYIVLKHDIETNVSHALEVARIEAKYGHCGSYYVQAYLLDDINNISLLKKIQELGHEVSYHYDVMDSNKGNLDQAIIEFNNNKQLFETNGFSIKTVCQHGNPIIERIGYSSNRDFFRSYKVKDLYPDIADIMVDFKDKANTEYIYYSDAGRHFNMIYDPINNDIVNSDDKNVSYDTIEDLLKSLEFSNNAIISIHPHRWCASAFIYNFKNIVFKVVKKIAKICIKIPGLNRIVSKYYYVAKKF